MIVWGTSAKKNIKSSGDFYCPHCDSERQYIYWDLDKYFDIFWIPLFKTSDISEFVECQTCKNAYKPAILDYRPPSPDEQFLQWLRSQVETWMPLHMLHQKLTQNGIDSDTADAALDSVTSGSIARCLGCGFEYGSEIDRCTNCGEIPVVVVVEDRHPDHQTESNLASERAPAPPLRSEQVSSTQSKRSDDSSSRPTSRIAGSEKRNPISNPLQVATPWGILAVVIIIGSIIFGVSRGPSEADQCSSLVSSKNYHEALTHCNAAIAADASNQSSYSNRCRARLDLADNSGAVADCSKAIELDSGDYNAYNNRCLARDALGDFKGALDDCNAAVQADPGVEEPLNNRCMVNADLGKLSAALDDCDEALRLQPKDSIALGNRCTVRLQSGDTKGGLQDCFAALKIDPTITKIYPAICASENALASQFSSTQRVADCTKAVRIATNKRDKAAALSQRCSAYFDAKNFSAAFSDCNAAVSLDPKEPETFAGRGTLYISMGDRASALADFQRAADLFKQRGDTQNYQYATGVIQQLQQ